MHACIHTYIHYIHTYIHTYTHTLPTYIHTYIYIYIHTLHTYIYTCIHTYIHTYERGRLGREWLGGMGRMGSGGRERGRRRKGRGQCRRTEPEALKFDRPSEPIGISHRGRWFASCALGAPKIKEFTPRHPRPYQAKKQTNTRTTSPKSLLPEKPGKGRRKPSL